jgi:hypothetical protein
VSQPFLREITEPQENFLRLVLGEAFVLAEAVTVEVGGAEITGCRPIRSVEGSRLFEIIWDFYVAYSVRKESYVTLDESEEFSGRLARIYSKSLFLDYISHSTFACDQHPAPLHHIGLLSECPIIEVISTKSPQVRQMRPRPAL